MWDQNDIETYRITMNLYISILPLYFRKKSNAMGDCLLTCGFDTNLILVASKGARRISAKNSAIPAPAR